MVDSQQVVTCTSTGQLTRPRTIYSEKEVTSLYRRATSDTPQKFIEITSLRKVLYGVLQGATSNNFQGASPRLPFSYTLFSENDYFGTICVPSPPMRILHGRDVGSSIKVGGHRLGALWQDFWKCD